MLLAHRIRLDPTPVQRDYFARAAGTARIRHRRQSRKIKAARRAAGIAGPIPKATRLPVSANRSKGARTLARLHARITRVRKDFMHTLTARLCRENQTVVIEHLNVRDMLANARLSRAIADVGFYEFRRQLQYKAGRYATTVILADRWYPSSKLCSRCGTRDGELRAPNKTFRARRIVEDSTLVRRDECNAAMEGARAARAASPLLGALNLGERDWTGSRCGARHDRDVNAAIDLKRLATGACAAQSALPVASLAATPGTAAGMGSAGGGKVTPARHEHGQPDGSGQEQNDAHFRAHF
jgi:putative transposase